MPGPAQRSGWALLRHPWGVLGTVGGAGLSPRAPGTVGSAVALLPMPWLAQLAPSHYLLALAIGTALAVPAGSYLIRALGREDPPCFVFDEVLGVWLTLFLVPADWRWWLVGFVLFRFFDILKPWPVSWLDRRCKGGFGATVDDLMAAVYAAAVLQTLLWLLHR